MRILYYQHLGSSEKERGSTVVRVVWNKRIIFMTSITHHLLYEAMGRDDSISILVTYFDSVQKYLYKSTEQKGRLDGESVTRIAKNKVIILLVSKSPLVYWRE